MKLIPSRECAGAVLLILLATTGTAQAGSINGQVKASVVLIRSCQVNNGDMLGEGSGVDFGSLDFGGHSTRFSSADSLVSSSGNSGISILCSPGADATLKITGGTNDGPAAASGMSHALAHDGHYIPYQLYTDAARSVVLANDHALPVVADGTLQHLQIYARAFGAPGLTAGTYTDTLSVELAF